MAKASHSYILHCWLPMLLLSDSVNPLERGGALFLLQADPTSCQRSAGVTRITAFFQTLRPCSFDPIASPLDQPSTTPFWERSDVLKRSKWATLVGASEMGPPLSTPHPTARVRVAANR